VIVAAATSAAWEGAAALHHGHRAFRTRPDTFGPRIVRLTRRAATGEIAHGRPRLDGSGYVTRRPSWGGCFPCDTRARSGDRRGNAKSDSRRAGGALLALPWAHRMRRATGTDIGRRCPTVYWSLVRTPRSRSETRTMRRTC